MTPTTGETITSFCQSKRIPHRAIRLDDEPAALLHIVGHERKKIIYYFHGGGYIQPIFGPGQVSFALECAQAADAQIAFLEYTLAPELQYPGQLIQAVRGLNLLLKDHPPSSLILGGDSAGGNVCLGLLAHLKQPSPYVPKVDLQFLKFRGVYLISPWVGIDYNSDSYIRNNDYDFITRDPQMLNVTKFWNPKPEDLYANPLGIGSSDFWSAAATTQVQHTLITTGTREIFYDDIVEFAGKIGASLEEKEAKIYLAKCEKEVHTSCLLDSAINAKVVGMRKEVLEFLNRLK